MALGSPAFCRVYPRGCGGTGDRANTARLVLGLSPRVRGNQLRLPYPFSTPRSIPAGAGEPPAVADAHSNPSVYPRGCGGTPLNASKSIQASGLSPRVRGNHNMYGRLVDDEGSIPAGAGEPAAHFAVDCQCSVYPRGCGGTSGRSNSTRMESGLSPRVRGNLNIPNAPATLTGSIPAGAGEPQPRPPHVGSTQVYPRGCGGTSLTGRLHLPPTGLSPRVRGNRAPNLP